MLSFVWSPVRFFEARLHRPPNWALAFGAPIVCGVLDMAAVLIVAGKNQDALEHILLSAGLTTGALGAAKASSVLTAAGYPIYFALAAAVLACLDVLTKDSGRQLRLVEFAGLSFCAFIPSVLFMLGVAVFWTPPVMDTLTGASFLDVQAVVARYVDAMRASASLSTAAVVYYCCLAWCAALLGVALKVTAGFQAKAAAVASALIFTGFSGVWR